MEAAEKGSARRADATDWPRIAALYAQLLQVQPSPVVALNRVVAVLRSEGGPPDCRLRGSSGRRHGVSGNARDRSALNAGAGPGLPATRAKVEAMQRGRDELFEGKAPDGNAAAIRAWQLGIAFTQPQPDLGWWQTTAPL